MKDLIERLERASGPDRELANDVLFACGWTAHETSDGPDRHVVWESPDGHGFEDGDQPDPTASLDAARSLGGMIVYASDIGADGLALVKLVFDTTTTPIVEYTGIHSRLEIAYVIAALRARAASERDMEGGR